MLFLFVILFSSTMISFFGIFMPFNMVLLVALVIFTIFIQKSIVNSDFIFIAFIIASIVWTILAFTVWFGLTNTKPIHIGLWALTTDAQVKPNGPFVNGNVLAIFNACAWVISTYYAIRWQQWYGWLLSFFFLLGVSISLAWGAWLAIVPLFLWIVIDTVRRKQYKTVTIIFIIALSAFLLGQTIVNATTKNDGFKLELRQQNHHEHGINERKLIWLASYEMWRDHPLFGVGVGQFSANYLSYQSKVLQHNTEQLPNQTSTNSAHNLLLQLMAEAGIAGILLWLVITIFLLRLSWHYRWETDAETWPALACAWLLWIQGMGNITMSRPYPVLMFALFLGIAAAPSLRRSMKIIIINKHMVVLLLFMASAWLGFLSIQKTQAWLDYERLMYADTSKKEQLRLTQQLIKEPSILPHLIGGMIGDRLLKPELRQSTLSLEPYLQQALTVRQDPRLLEQQFYMHVLNKRWDKACTIAAILMPMKIEKDNHKAYLAACNKKMPQDFVFH